MIFNKETVEVGGKMVIPASFVNKTEPGEIVAVTKLGVSVCWFKGERRSQTAFYTFDFLNNYYGDKLAEEIAKDSCSLDDGRPLPW